MDKFSVGDNAVVMMNKTIQAMADTMKVLEKERDQSKLDELKLNQEKIEVLEAKISLQEKVEELEKTELVKDARYEHDRALEKEWHRSMQERSDDEALRSLEFLWYLDETSLKEELSEEELKFDLTRKYRILEHEIKLLEANRKTLRNALAKAGAKNVEIKGELDLLTNLSETRRMASMVEKTDLQDLLNNSERERNILVESLKKSEAENVEIKQELDLLTKTNAKLEKDRDYMKGGWSGATKQMKWYKKELKRSQGFNKLSNFLKDSLSRLNHTANVGLDVMSEKVDQLNVVDDVVRGLRVAGEREERQATKAMLIEFKSFLEKMGKSESDDADEVPYFEVPKEVANSVGSSNLDGMKKFKGVVSEQGNRLQKSGEEELVKRKRDAEVDEERAAKKAKQVAKGSESISKLPIVIDNDSGSKEFEASTNSLLTKLQNINKGNEVKRLNKVNHCPVSAEDSTRGPGRS